MFQAQCVVRQATGATWCVWASSRCTSCLCFNSRAATAAVQQEVVVRRTRATTSTFLTGSTTGRFKSQLHVHVDGRACEKLFRCSSFYTSANQEQHMANHEFTPCIQAPVLVEKDAGEVASTQQRTSHSCSNNKYACYCQILMYCRVVPAVREQRRSVRRLRRVRRAGVRAAQHEDGQNHASRNAAASCHSK